VRGGKDPNSCSGGCIKRKWPVQEKSVKHNCWDFIADWKEREQRCRGLRRLCSHLHNWVNSYTIRRGRKSPYAMKNQGFEWETRFLIWKGHTRGHTLKIQPMPSPHEEVHSYKEYKGFCSQDATLNVSHKIRDKARLHIPSNDLMASSKNSISPTLCFLFLIRYLLGPNIYVTPGLWRPACAHGKWSSKMFQGASLAKPLLRL
jgi:hypothetical protein